MKRWLLIIILCAGSVAASAQENPAELMDLRLFEYEFGYGINFGPRWGDIKVNKPGNNLILEMRLNRPEPFDFGVQFKMGNFVHDLPGRARVNSIFIRPSLYFDYNYRIRNICLFTGIGFGGSFIHNEGVEYLSPNFGWLGEGNFRSFAVTPRAGIAFFRGFFRVTAEYVITHRDYQCFNLNFGAVFGGSYKPTAAQKRNRKISSLY